MGWRANQDRASHSNGKKSASSVATTAPRGSRNRGRSPRPNPTARHDKAHIARGRAHQGRKTTRTPREIEHDEVGPLSDPNAAGGVRLGETTASKSHFEDVPGGNAPVHPCDAVRELDLAQHGRDIDHRVVRPEVELNT